MQTSKNSWVFLVIVAVLTALSVVGLLKLKPVYGLDIEGGVKLVYQIDQTSIPEDSTQTLSQIQRIVLKNLERRAIGALAVAEPTVQAKGIDQIVIELPGSDDIAKAKEIMSSTAKIQIYHAKNVVTPEASSSSRRYAIGDREQDENGAPVVSFNRTRGNMDPIEAGTEEYAKMIEGWTLILEGEDVARAEVITANKGVYQPQFYFTKSGADKMSAFTRRYASLQENIAFVLEGRVLSIAHIKKGAQLSDNAFIDGEFEVGYVRELVELVNSGALPVDLNELSSSTVDPTLGKAALDQIVVAGLVSLAAICLFLVVYYAFPGVVAAFAMALYVAGTLAVLMAMRATFSLAAIAALVLSVGMAVDANILVFERIKEELRAGRKLQTAISLGFRRALTAIMDSNIATILTSIVLWQFGQGAVKGFAITLIVGVLLSFLTAFTVTRSILVGLVGSGIGTDEKWYGLKRNWFGESLEAGAETKPLNIVSNAKRYFLLSAAFIAIGGVFIGMGGIKPNVEFQGGIEATFYLDADSNVTSKSLVATLEEGGITKANVKFGSVEDARVAYITVAPGGGVEAGDTDAIEKIAAAGELSTENATYSSVGPTIQAETWQNAIKALVFASALIVLFLAVRFGVALGGLKNGLKFGLSAIAALIHDVLVVVGTAGIVGFLLGWEISALFITAMLTVIGFSVHDSIVIFDRIRENLRRPHGGETFEHLVNKSITQSVARSINTSVTAVVPLAILIAIGTPTPELKFMCVAMLTGIVVGTYSSIFNAAPILYLWDKAIIKKRGANNGLMAEASREAKLRATRLQAQPEAAAEGVESGSAYGQIKRRSSVQDQATQNLDEDEE